MSAKKSMLSIFPTLFSYALAVPFVFRIILGAVFIFFGYRIVTGDLAEKSKNLEEFKLKPGIFWLWLLIFIEIAGGILLLVGLLTQIASLALSILLLIGAIARRKNKKIFDLPTSSLLLLLAITLSLMFLGPGFYAFDLPL